MQRRTNGVASFPQLSNFAVLPPADAYRPFVLNPSRDQLIARLGRKHVAEQQDLHARRLTPVAVKNYGLD